MKKFIVSLFCIAAFAVLFSISAFAVEISLSTPSEQEIELMTTRDFYIIGKIDRGNDTAETLPLNIRIELFDSDGLLVRSLKSNVAPNGVTSAEYFLTSYSQGYAQGDSKGVYTLQLTPPDIMYDGTDYPSVNAAYTKLVVKENYFAAIIFGGATKNSELAYVDEYGIPLNDITAGNYKLCIIAINLSGEEVASFERKLIFADTVGRVVSSDDNLIKEYAENNNLTLNTSIIGLWQPDSFLDTQSDFSYITEEKYNTNAMLEYGNASKLSILLYNITEEFPKSIKFNSALNSESEKTYLYYDIGENVINFTFNDALLTKIGNIIKSEESKFVKILRSEMHEENNSYIDYNSSDGFVLTEGKTTDFYGVFSPDLTSLNPSNIKYAVVDEYNNVLLEGYTETSLKKASKEFVSKYEFSFSVTPKDIDTSNSALYIYAALSDSDGKELFKGDLIPVKINNGGNFIYGYDKTEWCVPFCETINNLGQPPEGDALKPSDFITRGSFCSMINRVMGYAVNYESTFTDLSEDSIYYRDCAIAQGIGYMTGSDMGTALADSYISREQAIAILARISNPEMGETPIRFLDEDKVSPWAKELIDKMSSNGIVVGSEGYLNPSNYINSSEAAALIIKTYKWMHAEKKDEVNIPVFTPEDNLFGVEISDNNFIENVNEDSLTLFVKANNQSLDQLILHLFQTYPNGIYISKVGKGLDVRDYLTGSQITLSENALKLITDISQMFSEFSLRYNPSYENAVHFVLGKNEDGKQIGLTYTKLTEVKNRDLTNIDGSWYYYTQK